MLDEDATTFFFTLITRLKAHVLISNLASSRLKKTMMDSQLMAEDLSVHAEWIDDILLNIKTFIICLIHIGLVRLYPI